MLCTLSRRLFLGGLGATLLACGAPTATLSAPQAERDADLRALEERLGGRVGVFALDTSTGATVSHRSSERFALCSTFKWVLAAAVLARIDTGQLDGRRELVFTVQDLLEYAPVAREHLAEGRLPIDTLLGAILTVSDNTAANLLLNLLGGPAELTEFMRAHGDSVTRLDRREPELNANSLGDLRDTTTPVAMVKLMRTFLVEPALSSTSQERLIEWMQSAATGARRLRAGLPATWRVGDKTGTGANGAVNDVAIAWPPSRAPVLIAAYLSESTRSVAELEDAQAAIGRIVATRLGA